MTETGEFRELGLEGGKGRIELIWTLAPRAWGWSLDQRFDPLV